jgi:PAS domain S-box-containing protein
MPNLNSPDSSARSSILGSGDELRLVIDTIPAMAWVVLADGKVEFLNRRWLDYSGLSLQEAIEQPTSTMHPEDLPGVLEAWRERMVSGESYEGEMRLRRADGEYRWFLVRTVPLLDEQGKIVKWYGTSTDIEDRKRAERAVQEHITEHVRAEAALRESARSLQHLSQRLMAVQEEERRNLSRELHDEFGQILATITLHLQAAKAVAGQAAQPSLQESMNLLQRAGAQVRSLALELRPTMLETAGLDATVHWLAKQHEQRTGVVTEVIGHLNDATGDLAIACFRVVQEALTNVLRHSRALHVWIELSQSERALELVIRDDGIGFDVTPTLEQAAARGHLGVLGMKERVQILGGSLEVDSKPARGTRVRISLPLLEQPVPEGAERAT